MRSFAFICLAASLFVAPGLSIAETTLEADQLDRLRGWLAGLDFMSAEFEQQIFDVDQQLLEQASGTVSLRKPGRFRWVYQIPYERVIVADGERIWLYEADLEQVTIRKIGMDIADSPAALLTGSVQALDRFDYDGGSRAEGIDTIRLRPKSATADFGAIELVLRESELVTIEFTDRLAQRTRIHLSGIDRQHPVDDAAFVFEIPDGVDVIREDTL